MSDKPQHQDATTNSTPGLIPLERAIALAQEQVAPTPDTMDIPLDLGLGRVSARDIPAPEAMPFFDNSAMDGFALRVADLGDTTLPVTGTIPAGAAPRDLIRQGADVFEDCHLRLRCSSSRGMISTKLQGRWR